VKKIGKAGMCQQRKRRELTNHQKLVKETGMIEVQEVHGPWRTLPQVHRPLIIKEEKDKVALMVNPPCIICVPRSPLSADIFQESST